MPQHTVNEQLKNRSGAVNRRVDKLASKRDNRSQVNKSASATNRVPARTPSVTPRLKRKEFTPPEPRTPSRLPGLNLPVISAPTLGVGNNIRDAFKRAGDQLRQNREGGQLNRAVPPPSPFQPAQPVTPQLPTTPQLPAQPAQPAQPIQTVAPQPAPQAAPQVAPQPQVQAAPVGQPVQGPVAPVAPIVPQPVPFAPPRPVAQQRVGQPRGPLNAPQRFAPQGQFPQGQGTQLGGGLNRNQMLNFMNVLQQLMQRFQGQGGAF